LACGGFESLYFSANDSNEGQAKCEGGSEGNREKDLKDERSEYEPKANKLLITQIIMSG